LNIQLNIKDSKELQIGKKSRKCNKLFLLGMFGLVFSFGMPVSLVFSDEIPYYMDGEIIRYDYKLANGSPDWDTFYRRCNQYAGQDRYYMFEVSDVYGGGGQESRLSRFGTKRFTFVNRSGAMVTMTFTNISKRERIQTLRKLGVGDEELIEAEHEFTDYDDALRFWRNAVEILR
jgi:hypothetical protein